VIAGTKSAPALEVAARREATAAEPGLPYSSPTPDWNSRYGVAPVADSGAPAGATMNAGLLLAPENEPVSMRNYERSAIQQTSAVVEQPAGSAMQMPAGNDAYALERALLNAGPGSLFPVPAPRATDASPRNAGTIAPTNYEMAPSDAAGFQCYTTTANQSASIQIQSPAGGANSYGAAPNSIPLSPGGQLSPAATALDGGYQQFPGRAAAPGQAADPLRQYEAELQTDPYGSARRYR
jgi:hypothetical protein